MKFFFSFIISLFPIVFFGQISISGYVYNETGEPLVNVHIIDTTQTNTATLSNNYGFFTISGLKKNSRLRISYVGFVDTILSIIDYPQDLLEVYLRSYAFSELEVTAKASPLALKNISTINLPIAQIAQLPTLAGEADPLKALAFLPGVGAGFEGSSNIVVRGGTPDQNLILLDGAPVYNVNHLFGFFSLFNVEAIKNVEISKGGYSAKYGGRISSIIAIDLKEGNRDTIKKSLQIGAISSHFSIDGPLNKEKNLSFLFAGRTSYLDLVTLPQRIFFNTGSGGSFFNYNVFDINAKLSYHKNQKNKYFLSFYGGNDQFKEKYRETNSIQNTRIGWRNQTLSLRSMHQMKSKLFLKNNLAWSRYNYRIADRFDRRNPRELLNAYESNSGLQSISWEQNMEYAHSVQHQIRLGYELTHYRFLPQSNEIRIKGGENFFEQKRIQNNAISAYLEDVYTPLANLELRLGLRANLFLLDEKSFAFLEPRINASWEFANNWQVSGNYTQMNQALHLISNNATGLPSDLWVPATAQTPPQSSEQWGFGIQKNFMALGTTASLEYYRRKSTNLIDFQENKDFLSTLEEDWESLIERNGTGWSEGFEFLIHKKAGRLNGIIAYALAWHNRQFDNINFGKVYPFRYDRRHDASFNLNYQLNENWRVATSWIFHTGNAFTLPTARYELPEYAHQSAGRYTFAFNGRNMARLPDYQRIDLGFSHTKLNKKGRERSWRFGFYNLLNRQNVYFLEVINDKYVEGYVPFDPTIERNDRTIIQGKRFFSILPYLTYGLSW